MDENQFNRLLSELNLKPEECVFAGSSFNDIGIANKINISTIRIRRGGVSSEETPSPEMAPQRELKSLSELVTLVDEGI